MMTINLKYNDDFEVVPSSDERCEKCGIPLDTIIEDKLCEGCE